MHALTSLSLLPVGMSHDYSPHQSLISRSTRGSCSTLEDAGACHALAGVFRNRFPVVHGCCSQPSGELEDQFFATVFLGSSLLYDAMMFINGSVASAAIGIIAFGSDVSLTSGTYDLARAEVHVIGTVYATKMAGVFMISASTIFLQTRVVPRSMALLGYALALVL